jgi:hypothetical protein
MPCGSAKDEAPAYSAVTSASLWRKGFRTVDLTTYACRLAPSKHLQMLHSARFVSRRRNGLFIFYELADDDVLRLCEMVCGRLDDETATMRALLALR